MKPTAPGGLQEKWIIPILREVAEAIKWVHQAGIIHRDIKCNSPFSPRVHEPDFNIPGANVLITEQGGLQLCDFGVAGIIENKLDKRSTVIGTPHWMAPELFAATPSYGKEVDIWAFGSMMFEIATGLPPNVANGIPYERLGSHLKQNVPRLEGGDYSNDLRDLVAFCLEEIPSSRPTIEQVQKHTYIWNTSSRYPASTLSYLVRAFKMWEDHGGSRKSLFMMGGAQGPSEGSSNAVADDEWNFSTTAAFDQEVSRESTAQDVYEAYGAAVELDDMFAEETSRPTQPQKLSRRRPPPEALARLPAPLEKIFDPNTLSNYKDNSHSQYGESMQTLSSDLPLRDDTAQTSIRDTMIDLGGHDSDTGLSNFPNMDTIKAARRSGLEESEDEYTSTLQNFSRPALSDPADVNTNRRTQDWKFPTMAPPASADGELSRFPSSFDIPRPTMTPGSGGRPALVHHPTEPVGAAFGGNLLASTQNTLERLSMRESLIDLDMSMPDVVAAFARPSTANSDAGSTTSEQMTSGNPFELERHTSLYQFPSSDTNDQSDPEIYVTDATLHHHLDNSNPLRDMVDISDFSASDAEISQEVSTDSNNTTRYDTFSYSDSDMPRPPISFEAPYRRQENQPYTFTHFPGLPSPPSAKALSGVISHEEMKDEFNRMLGGMTAQLEAFRDVYNSPHVVQKKGLASQRRERRDDSTGKVGKVTGILFQSGVNT
jgi:serine/threonine protein kinase